MQPLSKVNPRATVTWGAPDTMTHPQRAKVATLVANCIAEWADIETMLGLFLGLLLKTDSAAALSIYSSLENRSAQRRIVLAAAESKLLPDHFDLLCAVFNVSIAPAMKERDKLAHWSWAYSEELPDRLLLTEPRNKTLMHFEAVILRLQNPTIAFDPSKIYVVSENDLLRLGERLRTAKNYLTQFMATAWDRNSPEEREKYRQLLSSEPQIREAWGRLREARRNNREARQRSRKEEQSETP
jgi:hypothetical protein